MKSIFIFSIFLFACQFTQASTRCQLLVTEKEQTLVDAKAQRPTPKNYGESSDIKLDVSKYKGALEYDYATDKLIISVSGLGWSQKNSIAPTFTGIEFVRYGLNDVEATFACENF